MNKITLLAFTLAVAIFGVTLSTWFAAYSNPMMRVCININIYGEAIIELVVIPIVFVLCVVCLLFEWRKWWKS